MFSYLVSMALKSQHNPTLQTCNYWVQPVDETHSFKLKWFITGTFHPNNVVEIAIDVGSRIKDRDK